MGITKTDIDPQALKLATQHLQDLKVGVFVIAYNAEHFIKSVLERIPPEIRPLLKEVYVIDDSSKDLTATTAIAAGKELGYDNLTVLRTPYNRGYGGNQKIGYLYALEKDLDIVIMLHGDGQYPPEYIPQIINAFVAQDNRQEVSAVFASRMIDKSRALEGKMPLYKWLANQFLTKIGNIALASTLSEFHSGYRAYRTSALRKIPFQENSNDFHFDTEIIIQLVANDLKINELSIPTNYGDEVCHVNGIKYAFNFILSLIKFHLTQVGLFYQPNYDFNLFEFHSKLLKRCKHSMHQAVLTRNCPKDSKMLDFGARQIDFAEHFAKQGLKVSVITEEELSSTNSEIDILRQDLNSALSKQASESIDLALLLDQVAHLHHPEQTLKEIHNILKPGAELLISSGNIAYFVLRLSLLVGQFNYGKRGILDNSHIRLFTIYSLKKILTDNGFKIKEIKYFGPPIKDMIGDTLILSFLNSLSSLLAKLAPSLFAYSFLIVAERLDTLKSIFNQTLRSEKILSETDSRH